MLTFLAALLLNAPPTVADAPRLWARCQKADADACYVLGELRTVRIADPAVRAAAIAPSELDCSKEDAAACFALGMHLDDDGGLPIDGKRAFEVFGRACVAGFLPACTRQATFYVVGPPRNEPHATKTAQTILRRACDGGWPLACEDLAWHAEMNALPIDARRVVRGCQGGAARACVRLAALTSTHARPSKDAQRALATARERLDRLCKGGLPPACHDRDALAGPK